ncbi:hypothetical protein KOI35_13110 [Actinoplanes bogorensis]|uniref:Uncharacterized protein n=1 Tax=Paractinoplanes bogorensis TaxID=1610840 RepID=A0ABS5YLU9_9ACTN|nr:hypothetical protein [Actinoplanes bogorensis]MBU2664436.1 hypothetical protein [Actinoplanes bogorensis]
MGGEVGAFREVLAQQAVRVFVCSALPAGLGAVLRRMRPVATGCALRRISRLIVDFDRPSSAAIAV